MLIRLDIEVYCTDGIDCAFNTVRRGGIIYFTNTDCFCMDFSRLNPRLALRGPSLRHRSKRSNSNRNFL